MDILNKNQNLETLFDYNRENKSYQDYLEYLNLYYKNPTKNDKYDKLFENGHFFLIDKKNPKKKIEITPSKFTNLKKLYNDLKINNKIILEKISAIIEKTENYNDEDRNIFNNLKNQYSLYNKKIIEIDVINENYYKSMESLNLEQINLSNNLAEYYNKRNNIFKNITQSIPKKIKNKLIILFKKNNNKIPSDNEINTIAKNNTIPSKIIEEWFLWIEQCYYYLITKNKLYEIIKEINLKEKEFENKNKYMILKLPEIILE
jgi:hypothetical protein